MGRVAYDLGNVYRVIGLEPHNASVLFRVLQWPLDKIRTLYKDLSPAVFHHAMDAIDQAMQPLSDAQIARTDAGLIVQEYVLTARLLRHACRRALLALEDAPTQAAQLRRELDRDMQEFIPHYRKVWLSRNGPGGLADSVARFETTRKDYE